MSMIAANRPLEIAGFLEQNGWGSAAAQPFDGDFSPRRYARLIRDDGATAILMDADANQKTPIFVALAKILRADRICAPEIYAALPNRGLVLMGDFGVRNVGALLDGGEDFKAYLLRATDILARLHHIFHSADSADLDLPHYNAELFSRQAELFLDAYFPLIKNREATDEERQDFLAAWQTVLRFVDTLPRSLMLRDFMPDNLMDLPNDELGVLDFQDAGLGPVAYDLASLCEEVRRDGAFAMLPDVIAHYRTTMEKQGTANPPSENDMLRACTILSAQRHTRILGIVAQLATKTGRREKIDLIPRLTRHLDNILTAPYLLPVRAWMRIFNESDA